LVTESEKEIKFHGAFAFELLSHFVDWICTKVSSENSFIFSDPVSEEYFIFAALCYLISYTISGCN
jgi:hypothetical protein